MSETSENVSVKELESRNLDLERQVNNLSNIIGIMNELTLTLDLNEMVENILDILVMLIGSKRHSIALTDQFNMLQIVASKFCDDEIDYHQLILKKGIIQEVFSSQQPFITDTITENNADDVIACIPLIVRDKVIGLIIIHEFLSHKDSFTDEDKELLNLISIHAGNSLLAAQEFQKSKQAMEKKENDITELYNIFDLVSSAIKIDEVLDVITNTTKEILKCNIVAIYLYDPDYDKLILRKAAGIKKTLENKFILNSGEAISGKVFLEKKPILIKNIKREIRYKDLLNTKEAKLYHNSILSVPIVIHGNPIGILVISDIKDGKGLDVNEKKILVTIAAQTATGLNNSFMYEKQEKELDKISRLFKALNNLHITVNLNDIYKTIEQLLINFVGVKSYSLFLKDSNTKKFLLRTSKGMSKEKLKQILINEKNNKINKMMKEKAGFITKPFHTPEKIHLTNQKLNLYACIPLHIEDRLIGTILVHNLTKEKGTFTQFDKDLFALIAQHAAISIVRAKLLEKSEEKTISLYDISRLLAVEYDLQNAKEELEKTVKNKTIQLIAERDKFNLVIENITDGILVLNKNYRISHINAAVEKMMGVKRSDLLGKHLKTEFKEIFESSLIQENKYFNSEELNITNKKDNTIYDTKIYLAPIMTKTKELNYSITIRDITKEKKLNEMKSQFVSNVSHEMRTPLACIKGFAATILYRDNLTEIQKKNFLEIINKESDRLTMLIEDLLSLARIESSSFELQLSKFSLKEITNDISKEFANQLESKKVKIKISTAGSLPVMIADKDKIYQLILNLLSNSIKFTKENSIIKIDTNYDKKKRAFSIAIQDQGPGIAKKDIEKIFEKFFRVEDTVHTLPGTGLGLSIVKNIIDSHKGTIKVNSTLGKGSTFLVHIPQGKIKKEKTSEE